MVPSDHGGVQVATRASLASAWRRSRDTAPWAVTDQACHRSAPGCRDLDVGVPGQPVDAGTAGTGEPGRLALVTTSRAEAPDLLASPLPTGEALWSSRVEGERGCPRLWGHNNGLPCCEATG